MTGKDLVPALAEHLAGIDMVGWFALMAPTGAAAAAITRANRDINALLNDKEVAERIAAMGPIGDGSMAPDAVASFLRSESALWQNPVRELGVLPE